MTPSSNTAFRLVWALSLGWAIAEACAGIVQGYEQLALYADADPAEYLSPQLSHSALASRRASFQSQLSGPATYVDVDEEELGEESGGERPGRERALGLVRRSVWMADNGGEGDDGGGKSMNRAHGVNALDVDMDMGIDEAFERLANVKAREDLEELYGEPYIVRFGHFKNLSSLSFSCNIHVSSSLFSSAQKTVLTNQSTYRPFPCLSLFSKGWTQSYFRWD